MSATTQQPSLQRNFGEVETRHAPVRLISVVTLLVGVVAQQPSIEANFGGVDGAVLAFILLF